jgi:hypothetical protein
LILGGFARVQAGFPVVAGQGHQRVTFVAAFFDARFGSAWAVRHSRFGQSLEQIVGQLHGFAAAGGLGDDLAEMAHGLNRAFKADASYLLTDLPPSERVFE